MFTDSNSVYLTNMVGPALAAALPPAALKTILSPFRRGSSGGAG